MATNPPGENITKITGRVRTRGTGQAIFGARVRLSGHRRGTTTDENGDFALSVPTRVLGSSATFYILMTDMWPRRVVVPITGELIQLTGEQCTLDPIGTFWTKHIVGQAAALFGPKLVMFWYGSTARERILYCVVLVTGIIPVFLAAIDAGLPLPLTDFDEVIRESLQRTIALPWERGPVRFSKIRRTYHAKVNYVIPSSQYKVEGDVLIWKGAKVTIEPGSRFLMGPHAGFRIEGLLNAEGESEQPITFGRANPQMSWSNLTFWGQGSVKSRLKYCVIEGGAGRPCSSATEGNVYDDPNGSRKGGGLLLYDTYISVENTQIINCRANAGGGIYQRNALTPDAGAALPGSSFKSVIVTKCFAKAGGGAVFAQRCYPEFAKCSFEENGADGRNSCGGAVYMGLESRAKFTDCTFSHNTANAEGGAIYALQCYTGGSEQLCGVYVSGGLFADNLAHGKGGAVSALNSRVAFVGVQFTNNTVEELTFSTKETTAAGGAIYLEYTAPSSKDNLPNRIATCEFTNNTCNASSNVSAINKKDFSGGALHIRQSAWMRLALDHVTFNNNHAPVGQHVSVPADLHRLGWSGDWGEGTHFREPDEQDRPECVYMYTQAVRPYAGLVAAPKYSTEHLLPNSFYDNRPDGVVVNTVVIHFISAATVDPADPHNTETILRILAGEAEGATAKVSAHYLIDFTGKAYRLVEERFRAWHAGLSAMPSGEENVNDFSIGIEMVRTADEPPTNDQYETLVALLCDIRRRFPTLTGDRIVGHDMIRRLWHEAHPDQPWVDKQDPGPLFHWSRLFRSLNQARFE